MAEELSGMEWPLSGSRNVLGFNGIAPVLWQKLEETAEATAEIKASYASFMGRADGPVLASVDTKALESCSCPKVGRDWGRAWETDRVVDCALLDVLSILADTAEELELFGVLEELGPNRRFLARPSGSKAFHSAMDRVKPHLSRVLGKIGGSG